MLFIKRDRISEANIQAEIYHRLKVCGIPCYLEYKVDKCRFDIVILKEHEEVTEIIAIVEVKSKLGDNINKINYNGRQFKKYSSYGLPLLYCTNMSCVYKTVGKILRIYNS